MRECSFRNDAETEGEGKGESSQTSDTLAAVFLVFAAFVSFFALPSANPYMRPIVG